MVNRYVGNLPPMPGVFPDYPAPVIRNTGDDREMTLMRWGMPPPLKMAARRSPTSGTSRSPSELRAAGTLTKKQLEARHGWE